jgi:hypothetical protein
MAIKKTIEIDVETKSAVTDIEKLSKSIDKLVDTLKDGEKQADETAKEVEEIGKSGTKAKKGIKNLSSGFKALGGAIKAVGIGLIITAFLTLKEVLGQNQKVVDTLSGVFGTITIVINKVFSAITDTFEAVSKATGGFDALGKVLKGVLTVAITPLKVAFFNIKLGLEQAQLAWEKSFFGDNDPKSVKALNESIKETKDSLIGAVVEGVNAGKDIVKNFGEAVSEVAELGTGLVENVSKVSIKASFEQSKLTQQLANNAKLAEAEQRKLIEQYDRQAEKLRQVRDNDLLSIEERKKANDELGVVLENQEKALLKQADAVLASAEAELKKNNNIENQVALIDAQANKAGILAQIDGLRSEQLTNQNALIKEQKDLVISGAEADTQRALNQQKFNTSLEEDALKRLEQQRLDLEAEKEIEQQRLQLKIDSFAEGTQARLDAENELKDRLQEINQEIILNGKEVTKQEKVNAEAQQKLDNATAENKKKAIDATKNILADASKLLGESTAAGKAAAVAAATIETYQSAVSSYNSLAGIPIVGPGLGIAAAGVAVASGIANVKNILSVKTPGGGGGGSVPGGSTPPPPPAFNLVGSGGGVEQIQDDLGGEQPVKAFVVGSEVTNQQEIDNAQAESASLG